MGKNELIILVKNKIIHNSEWFNDGNSQIIFVVQKLWLIFIDLYDKTSIQ